MVSERGVSTLSAVLSLVSVAVSLLWFEGIMLATSIFSLVFCAILAYRPSPGSGRLAVASSVILLVCTVFTSTVMSQQSLVDSGTLDSTSWILVVSLVHALPLTLVVITAYYALASVSGASYNWAYVRYLTVFMALGMQVPGFVLEYVFHDGVALDDSTINNGYILYGMAITIVVIIVFSYAYSRWLRSNILIINSNGTVKRE